MDAVRCQDLDVTILQTNAELGRRAAAEVAPGGCSEMAPRPRIAGVLAAGASPCFTWTSTSG